MKILTLDDLNYINKDKFTIVKNGDRFVMKYDNENFVIESETLFDECNIYLRDKSKIKINFNKEHKYFIKSIRDLYDIISDIIEINHDINVSQIVNPIYSNENKKMLFIMTSPKTQIKNIESDEYMMISDLYNKMFDMYPILYSPNINISNDKLYINFTFHTMIISSLKTIEEEITEISLDYDKIKKIMKKR